MGGLGPRVRRLRTADRIRIVFDICYWCRQRARYSYRSNSKSDHRRRDWRRGCHLPQSPCWKRRIDRGHLGRLCVDRYLFKRDDDAVPPPNATALPTGSSNGKIRVSGPSVGGYYTYFNGSFSNDTTLKADFLSINESFSEVLAFTGAGPGGTPQFNSGAGSANVTNFVAAQNFQYRFPISAGLWFEPTAGYRYVNSHYDAGGAALGLQDGYDWRVQGGGRLGIESFWNAVHVTTTITGLAYSDVKIVGGPITGGATTGSFAGGTVLPSDQGKVRGEGIFLANFDYGRGFSTFVQADVRGGSGLFGAGGRVGARMQF